MKKSGIGLCAAVCSALVLCILQADGIETGVASGGGVAIDGEHAVHTFKHGGTFTLYEDVELDVLVVGGGGGGGNNGGGGGGAGGFVYTNAMLLPAGSYSVVVGAGGAAAPNNQITGSPGGNSSFVGLVALGGGGGASRDGGGGGMAGGSGGGGGGSEDAGRRVPGAGTPGQGASGGAGIGTGTSSAGGGGGGAGEAGTAAASQNGGKGGDGLPCSITGTEVWYSGGGGGGKTVNGSVGEGGRGGGGGGTFYTQNPGTPNTGGGGGGGSGGDGVGVGAAGGSGVVSMRYRISPMLIDSALGSDFGLCLTNLVFDRIFTISNMSDTATFSLTGTPAVVVSGEGDFVVLEQPAATTLDPGQSTTFTLRFEPMSVGTHTGLVSIASDVEALDNYVFSVAGAAESFASMAILDPGGNAIASGAPASSAAGTDFGVQVINRDQVDRTFTITNTGFATITFDTPPVALLGDLEDAYSVAATPSSPLAPGSATTFTLRFAPETFGAHTALVSIASDVMEQTPCTFALTGIGEAGMIAVLGIDGGVIPSGAAATTANGTDYGTRTIGSDPLDHTFVITNSGTETLVLNNLELASDAFELIAPFADSEVLAGATTTFTLRHRAGKINPTAQLKIHNNTLTQTPYLINVKATTAARNWVVVFDADPATSDAQDGSGVWRPGDVGWVKSDTRANTTWGDNDRTVFGAGNGEAGVVTLEGTAYLSALVFNPPGAGFYTISGGHLDLGTAYGVATSIKVTTDARIDSKITTGSTPGQGLSIYGGGRLILGGASTWGRNFSIGPTTTVEVVSGGNFKPNENPFTVSSGSSVIASGTGSADLAPYWASVTIGDATIPDLPATVLAQDASTVRLGSDDNGASLSIGNASNSVGVVTIRDNALVSFGTRGNHTLGRSAGATGIVNLEGGTLQILRAALVRGGGEGYLRFDGGIFKVNLNSAIGNFTQATVKAGGAKFDSNGKTLTVNQLLEHDPALGRKPDGGVTKLGAGTLALSAANTYTGPTIVEAGTLKLTQPSLSERGDVSIAASATLDLNFTGTNVVNALFIGGVQQLNGYWGKDGGATQRTTPRITGNGVLRVKPWQPPSSMMVVR